MSYDNAPGSTTDWREYRVIDLGRFFRILWRGRYKVIFGALAGAAIALGVSYLVKPRYDATVRLMPPDHKESLIASLSPSRNEGDLYLGLMQSRTVADDVIAQQHLSEYFHTTNPTLLRNMLAGVAAVSVDKNQFLSVTVRTNEAATSTRIANEFPKALYRLNHSVAVAQGIHRRDYFEAPLEEEKDRLFAAEEQLKLSEMKTGMVMPEAQVQLGLASISQLRQQITTQQAALAALLTSSTDQNPEVVRLRHEIDSLEGQLSHLQAQNGGAGGTNPGAAQTTLDVERKMREVKYHQGLLDTLSKQYENARILDSYSPPVELVDTAVLPDEKSWPPRRLWSLIGLFLGAFLALCFVLVQAFSPVRRLRALLRAPEPIRSNVPAD